MSVFLSKKSNEFDRFFEGTGTLGPTESPLGSSPRKTVVNDGQTVKMWGKLGNVLRGKDILSITR